MSDTGALLYGLLPEVYRNRDNPVRDAEGRIVRGGDLARYLDAFGGLLDRIRRTLDQQLADHFPDREADEAGCQPWVLDYLGALVDAQPLAPDLEGRRVEVANAVHWRSRKGTLEGLVDIARAVAGTEVVGQEGWQRLAVTPRIGATLPPREAFGEPAPASGGPAEGARHPGLAAVTPDLRRPSRAVLADPGLPLARRDILAGARRTWRRANPHGISCFPGSFQDGAHRTPDLRRPDWRRGHHHPRRLVLYAAPPSGLFVPEAPTVAWEQRQSPEFAAQVEIRIEPTELDGTPCSAKVYRGRGPVPVRVLGPVDATEPCVLRFENLWLDGEVTLSGPRLELAGAAARLVRVNTEGVGVPVLEARESLLEELQVPAGTARLLYCTVLGDLVAQRIEASDSIFAGPLRGTSDQEAPPAGGCLRYSRVPEHAFDAVALYEPTCTRAAPHFFADTFGLPGCGVLHPAAAEALRFGAEDGGELGAYHGRHYNLRLQAVLEKLATFLPVGMEAVWVPDETMRCAPPTVENP